MEAGFAIGIVAILLACTSVVLAIVIFSCQIVRIHCDLRLEVATKEEVAKLHEKITIIVNRMTNLGGVFGPNSLVFSEHLEGYHGEKPEDS